MIRSVDAATLRCCMGVDAEIIGGGSALHRSWVDSPFVCILFCKRELECGSPSIDGVTALCRGNISDQGICFVPAICSCFPVVSHTPKR